MHLFESGISQPFQGLSVGFQKEINLTIKRIILPSVCLASLLLSGISVWGSSGECRGSTVLEKRRRQSKVHCKAPSPKGGERGEGSEQQH